MKKHADPVWNAAQGAAENARRALPRLAREYFSLGAKTAAPKSSTDKLHRFRLATKRFRYTLEMFVPVYGSGLESRLKQVRRIQHVLGEVQDCHTVRCLDPVKANARLIAWIERRLRRKRLEFQRLWRREFSSPEAQRRWLQYLERYARERKS